MHLENYQVVKNLCPNSFMITTIVCIAQTLAISFCISGDVNFYPELLFGTTLFMSPFNIAQNLKILINFIYQLSLRLYHALKMSILVVKKFSHNNGRWNIGFCMQFFCWSLCFWSRVSVCFSWHIKCSFSIWAILWYW